MKRISELLLAIIITAFMTGGCGEVAREHAIDGKEDMKAAGRDAKASVAASDADTKTQAITDWKAFKNESDNNIAVLERQIRELRLKAGRVKAKEQGKLSADLNKAEQKLNVEKEKLKEKNAAFDVGVATLDSAMVAKNESFKREFRHDTDELGTAIKDLFRDNVK